MYSRGKALHVEKVHSRPSVPHFASNARILIAGHGHRFRAVRLNATLVTRSWSRRVKIGRRERRFRRAIPSRSWHTGTLSGRSQSTVIATVVGELERPWR